METFDQADSGYPEEGPPGASSDDAEEGGKSAVREQSRPDAEDTAGAPDNDDGQATGNPNN